MVFLLSARAQKRIVYNDVDCDLPHFMEGLLSLDLARYLPLLLLLLLPLLLPEFAAPEGQVSHPCVYLYIGAPDSPDVI